MVRIVHVGNFGLKPKGSFQHSVVHKISNGLIRNGHFVSHFSDRDIARAGTLWGKRKFGISAMNKALEEFCYHVQPDLLLLSHADIIKPITLAKIRQVQPSIKILQWTGDLLCEKDRIDRLSSKFDVVDASLVNMTGAPLATLAKMTTGTMGFIPIPIDFSVESGTNHEKVLPYDLFCSCGNSADIRNICGEGWLPEKLIGHIEANVPKMRPLLAGIRGQPTLVGGRYQSALESVAIGLNLSQRNNFPLYSSDRLAHMCGNGMAILIDRATGYEQLFNQDEFAFFSTVDELVLQVRRLVADVPYRQALAKAGRARYHALFNEKIIAKYIIEVAFGDLDPSNYEWPTIVEKCSV